MNQSPFKCLATRTIHPLLKHTLSLVINEGRQKRLLLLYKKANIALPQSSLAITGYTFCHCRLL